MKNSVFYNICRTKAVFEFSLKTKYLLRMSKCCVKLLTGGQVPELLMNPEMIRDMICQ